MANNLSGFFTNIITLLSSPPISYASMWNDNANKLSSIKESNEYPHDFPACFVELGKQENKELLNNWQSTDLEIKIHLLDRFFNDNVTGLYDYNLAIYQARNFVISKISTSVIDGCSTIFRDAEEQDYTHTNLYHYIITFKCEFIENDFTDYPTYPITVPAGFTEIINVNIN